MADQPNPPRTQAEEFLKNSAIAGVIVCPLVMLMPPRKVDLRFFVLASSFSLSTSHLAYVYTGESLYQRFQRRANKLLGAANQLPPEAQRTQQLLRDHKEAKERAQRMESDGENKQGIAKVAHDVWMGGEGEDWQKKRLAEHQEKMDEGKGMTGIIMDQVAEVWNGNWKPDSKKKDGEAANTSGKKP